MAGRVELSGFCVNVDGDGVFVGGCAVALLGILADTLHGLEVPASVMARSTVLLADGGQWSVHGRW
jgi:hypothetical protein